MTWWVGGGAQADTARGVDARSDETAALVSAAAFLLSCSCAILGGVGPQQGRLLTFFISWLPRRPRFGPLEPWQRQQYVVVATVALAQVAFDLTQPFIPLYIRELGVTDLADAAFWAGLVAGIAPLCSALTGPLWGAMADRFGLKAMVLRALIIISVFQFASAFVPSVQWLLGARIMMGLFAGFTTMSMALAIAVSPREKMAQAIGLVQAAQLAPTAIGPTIGGVISDLFGIRANFIMTGVILLVPATLLFFMVKDARDAPADRAKTAATPKGSVWSLFALPGFAAAVGILFAARFAERTLPPMLPLYLVELHTPAAQLATITGGVVAIGAVAAAASSMLYGRWARPETTRRLLMIALGGGAIFSALFVVAHDWIEVVFLRLVLGLMAGGAMSLSYTLGARMAPAGRSALTLSVLSSCAMLGMAVSPILAGLISQASLSYVFLMNAGVYAVALALAAVALPRIAGRPARAPEAHAERPAAAPR
jgi:DHA1 family multidrug resistance protein-like MFS transporter